MIVKNLDYSSESSPPDGASSASPSGDMSQNMSQDELRRRVSRIRTDHSNGQNISYPELTSVDALGKWISKLEGALQTSGIPPHQWSDAAIIFTAGSGPVNMQMRVRREARQRIEHGYWPWDEFKSDLREVIAAIENEPSTVQRLKEEHPVAAKVVKVAIGTGLVVAGTTVLAPAVVVGGLNTIGFTTGGVAANSIAAGMQSMLYGGATTGLFSICQSIGTAAVASSVITLATAAGTIAVGTSMLRSAKSENSMNDNPPNDPTNSNSSQAAPPPYRRQG